MLQTAHCVGGSVYPCFPKNEKIYGIYLVPTTEPNEIHGKVQICSPHEIEHYGIVVEFEGIITFSDRFKNVIKVFAPEQDANTILKSTVYHQICGRKEGLEKGDPPPQCLKKLRPISHIFEFRLVWPTTKSLPPTLTTRRVDVTYYIILYKRTLDGYDQLEQKQLKFYGYHGLSSPRDQFFGNGDRPAFLQEVTRELSTNGIEIMMQTPKKEYLRTEIIPWSISVRNEKHQRIAAISVSLIRNTTVFSESSTEILDTFVNKKTSGRKEFCIRGAFKGRRELPTFQCPGVHGLQVTYCIKCEVSVRDEEETTNITSGELEVVIGTTVISSNQQNSEDEITPLPFRTRCMSLASSMLTLFPPAYSQLSSRSGSVTSLETLPPHYDDLVQNFHEEKAE